ncbi:MAG TPA: lytic transglycosylase domain-containing protein [Thermoanaerobaculia bacterium]|nr:lytic transglycosylase domain-containing protein [Thermoanaerobaculia bacterium]
MSLRKTKLREWRPGRDYRIICSCQHHARRANSRWRKALRIASRGVAVLVGVPLALATFDLPSEAMNIDVASLPPLRSRKVPESAPLPAAPREERELTVFTEAAREAFIGSVAVQSAVTIDVFRENYFRTQVPYGSIIYREAKRNGLAPELVAAMVHTESDFRAGLISHKSAQGLMQIVPETARILGVNDIFDPQENIAAGTRYFRYLLNRFDNEQVALAAYNAGEGNVERFGGVPPFDETQRYIEKVNVRASRYRQRIRNGYVATMRMQPAAAH